MNFDDSKAGNFFCGTCAKNNSDYELQLYELFLKSSKHNVVGFFGV